MLLDPEELQPLPGASIARRGALARLAQWTRQRLEPPSFGLAGWSLSGGFVGFLGLMLWVSVLRADDPAYTGLDAAAMYLVAACFATMVLVWLFLISAGGYELLRRLGLGDGRIIAAIWCG